MALHHTLGTYMPLPCGLLACHGMMFADDGYGNYLRTDAAKAVSFLVSGRDLA